MPSKKHLRKRIRLLTATVEQLLIDNASYASRLAEEGRGKQLAEVRAREAQNRLDAARARVAQADRAALLDHDGAGWPEEVVDALARSLYGWPKPFQLEGFMRFKVLTALDAAARRAEAAAMNAHHLAEVAEAARDEANRYASSACVASLDAISAKVAAKVAVANAGGLTPTELAATIREQRGSGHRA